MAGHRRVRAGPCVPRARALSSLLCHRARGQNQEELELRIAEWTRRKTVSVLISELASADIPDGLTYNLTYRAKEMLENPDFQASEAIGRINDADDPLAASCEERIQPAFGAARAAYI
jgi:crotonobetainyl-CoA:carnitine CoA-transferase CaiB-like acyl-CoA transferase